MVIFLYNEILFIYLIQNTFNLRNSQQDIEDVGEGCVGNGKVIEKVIEKVNN